MEGPQQNRFTSHLEKSRLRNPPGTFRIASAVIQTRWVFFFMQSYDTNGFFLPKAVSSKLPKNFNHALFTLVYSRCRYYALVVNVNGDKTFYMSSRQYGQNVARYLERMKQMGILEMVRVGEANRRSNIYRWVANDL